MPNAARLWFGDLLTFAEMGAYSHECEGEMVCESTNAEKVPYFNAGMYLENKTQIGTVEEVFGNTTQLVRVVGVATRERVQSVRARLRAMQRELTCVRTCLSAGDRNSQSRPVPVWLHHRSRRATRCTSRPTRCCP